MDKHLCAHKKKKVPLVYPIVVYHGKKAYPYSTDLKDIIDAPPHLVEKYFLKPFQLIDLGKIDDEILKQHAWAGVMEFALKHIYERDIMPFIKNIAPILHELSHKQGEKYTQIVLQYIIGSGQLNSREDFFNLIDTEISHKVGDQIMTLAEQLKNEGKLESSTIDVINDMIK